MGLIDRQAAIDICDNVIDLFRGQFGAGVLVAIKESIEELPSAQPELIKIDCGKFTKEDWERIKKDLAKVPVHVFPAQLDVPDINVGELISRQAAIDAARDWYEGLICGSFKGLEKRLRALPPAEPKRGKWIHHPEIGWGETWLCDQCGEKTTSTVMGKPRANFCPNCGADMRGDSDE